MVFLLVVATLAAPVLALLVAEHLRERRRRKARGALKEEERTNA